MTVMGRPQLRHASKSTPLTAAPLDFRRGRAFRRASARSNCQSRAPDSHCAAVWSVRLACVSSWFEEVLGSEVVFLYVAHVHVYSPFFVGLKRSWDQKLSTCMLLTFTFTFLFSSV